MKKKKYTEDKKSLFKVERKVDLKKEKKEVKKEIKPKEKVTKVSLCCNKVFIINSQSMKCSIHSIGYD